MISLCQGSMVIVELENDWRDSYRHWSNLTARRCRYTCAFLVVTGRVAYVVAPQNQHICPRKPGDCSRPRQDDNCGKVVRKNSESRLTLCPDIAFIIGKVEPGVQVLQDRRRQHADLGIFGIGVVGAAGGRASAGSASIGNCLSDDGQC
jgi:hypothetical protein